MILLGVSLALGFLFTFLGTPFAEKYLLNSGIYGVDQQKSGKPKLATSGGIAVVFGFIISMTAYLGLTSLAGAQTTDVSLLLASLSSVCIITLIGLIDDIHINLEKYVQEELEIEEFEMKLDTSTELRTPVAKFREILEVEKEDESEEESSMHRKGLRQNMKMLFVLPAVLPLIAAGAGSWTMSLPILGTVNWGLLYPLVLLPVGLLFISNVVNMLAGTNGLSAGMSLVASASLGLFGYMNGSIEAALIAWSLSAALLAFLFYNTYPASILPGDSLTYLSGAAMFSAIVVGNMEKFGVFIFTPWIIEFFLKLRSGFKAHSWGILQEDGTLESQHEKIYSLTHPLMKKGFTEKQITYTLVSLEIVVCTAGIFIFEVLNLL
jgi:UDP-N-acetylglucosamine--dolichyl-phosphate N-acetylglucosaminephosphotransferase